MTDTEGIVKTAPLFDKKALRALIIPLIIEQVLGVSLGIVDTVMISSVSEASMSGVSLVGMITNLLNSVFAALATGGAVVISQFLGAKIHDRARESVRQLFFISFIISCVIAALVYLGGRGLLSLCFGDIEPDVMSAAMKYMRIMVFAFPAMALYNCAASVFRAVGNSRISMSASAVVNIFNILTNALFIYALRMGATGAALATMLSWYIAAAYLMVRLSDKRGVTDAGEPFYINLFAKFIPSGTLIGKILYIGVPSGIENSIFQLGRLVVVGIIAKFGTTQIAANAVANSIDSFGCIAGSAVGLAMITVVGRCIGAGDVNQAKSQSAGLMKTAYACTAMVNIPLLLSLPLTIKLFNLSPEAAELSIILIVLHNGFAMLFWPSSFVLPNALRAGGDVKFAMIVSVASMFVFRVISSYILGVNFGLGAIGVWISMIIDWIVRSAVFFARYKSGRWCGKSLVG